MIILSDMIIIIFPETSIWHDAVLTQESGMNVLGLVVFSIFFGIIIGRMGQKGKPLLDFFDSLSEATMQLIRLVIWYVLI